MLNKILVVVAAAAAMAAAAASAVVALAFALYAVLRVPFGPAWAAAGVAAAVALIMALGVFAVLSLGRVGIPGTSHLVKQNGAMVDQLWDFGWFLPDWWPQISWIWYVLIGCSVTIAFSILFKTPESQLQFVIDHVKRRPDSPATLR